MEQGKPWKYGDLTAPFDFPIYKSEEAIKEQRDSLLRAFEPYYRLNSEVEGEHVRKFVSDFSNGIPGLSDDYISIIANRLHSLYRQGIISSSDYKKLNTDTSRMIRIVDGKNAVSVRLNMLYTTKTAYEQLFIDEALEQHRQILQKCDLNDYITPNIVYDREKSTSTLNDLMNSIPLAVGVVQKGQKIIDRGGIVDEKVARILESYSKENERRSRDTKQIRMTTAGETLYVFIVVMAFTVYLSLFRKDYFENTTQHSNAVQSYYNLCTPYFAACAQYMAPCLHPSVRHSSNIHTCVHGLPNGHDVPSGHGVCVRQYATEPV